MKYKTENYKDFDNLIVFAENNSDRENAEKLSEHLNIKLTSDKASAQSSDMILIVNKDGLSLAKGGQILRGDYTNMIPRLKTANLQRELLIKAAKNKNVSKNPTAIDATAGMGEDALLLAASGFSVKLYEYDPIIAALLKDTMRRAAEIPELSDAVGRMQLFEENSIEALQKLREAADIVFLDPMFPQRQKSALVKKKFQLLQKLERPCSDEEELLNAALASKPYKVIIKRPLKGAFLAGVKPDYSVSGKAIRYDCIIPVNQAPVK